MGKKSAKIRGKILVNEMPNKAEKRLKLLKKIWPESVKRMA